MAAPRRATLVRPRSRRWARCRRARRCSVWRLRRWISAVKLLGVPDPGLVGGDDEGGRPIDPGDHGDGVRPTVTAGQRAPGEHDPRHDRNDPADRPCARNRRRRAVIRLPMLAGTGSLAATRIGPPFSKTAMLSRRQGPVVRPPATLRGPSRRETEGRPWRSAADIAEWECSSGSAAGVLLVGAGCEPLINPPPGGGDDDHPDVPVRALHPRDGGRDHGLAVVGSAPARGQLRAQGSPVRPRRPERHALRATRGAPAPRGVDPTPAPMPSARARPSASPAPARSAPAQPVGAVHLPGRSERPVGRHLPPHEHEPAQQPAIDRLHPVHARLPARRERNKLAARAAAVPGRDGVWRLTFNVPGDGGPGGFSTSRAHGRPQPTASRCSRGRTCTTVASATR